jgi:CheY-like chemotaxis protein
MNVLIVDDNIAYRQTVGILLSEKGWRVHVAGDGEEALYKMAKTRMDLIITDMYMPIMDGEEFHNTVRGISGYEQTPFLFISAQTDAKTMAAVKDFRVEAFHRRERPLEELLEKIDVLLDLESGTTKDSPDSVSTTKESDH